MRKNPKPEMAVHANQPVAAHFVVSILLRHTYSCFGWMHITVIWSEFKNDKSGIQEKGCELFKLMGSMCS